MHEAWKENIYLGCIKDQEFSWSQCVNVAPKCRELGRFSPSVRSDTRQLPARDQGGGADFGIGVREGTEDSMKSVFGTP